MISEKKNNKVPGLNHAIGALTSFEVDTFQFKAETQFEKILIEVYAPGILRIRITQNESFDTFAYPLVDDLQTQNIDFIDKTDEIVISTQLVELTIDKSPFRLIFRNKQGHILNEDDLGFGTSWIGEQVTTYKKLQPNEKFIGLGEKTGPLNKAGTAYENWNTDYFAYDERTDPIYCSIPFYIGVHGQNAYGIYFNNSHKTHFNFGASNNRFSSFSADRGDMDYFFVHGNSVEEIVQSYSQITGKMPLPPKWSIGYQQCRYSYYPDSEVLTTAKTFRDKEIPADAIVLDIHYMDKYKIYSWDKERFPNPKRMIDELKAMGFNVVVMCDPGIKVEEGYHTYDDGINKDVFIKYPDGEHYQGEVWPGWCHFPDFSDPKARDWWADQLKYYTALGVEGFWNDMNEIATWGNALPELIEFEFDGEKASSRKARNVYGLLMSKSTLEGAKKNLNGKRPFNLTRSGFSGIQRYSAVWTGDNIASEENMMLGLRMLNGMGLSGIPFAGFDTGGFIDNASQKLFARWVSIGAFTPFFRGHSNVNTKSSEPWSFGEHTEEISRNYINLRYKLMPYLYSVFYSSSAHGTPIHRSLVFDHPFDDQIYDVKFENEFYCGKSILVAPVRSDLEIEKIYLPEGKWYDLFTDEITEGNTEKLVECPVEKLPVYVKASSIIPIQSKVKNNQAKPSEVLEIHLYKGKTNHSFEYYEDDGESYQYERGKYYKRVITYLPKENKLHFGAVNGTYKSNFQKIRLVMHGFNSHEVESKDSSNDFRFIEPLTNFDPGVNPKINDYKIKNLPIINFDLKKEEFSIKW